MLPSNTMHYGSPHGVSGHMAGSPGHLTSHHDDHRNHFLSAGSHLPHNHHNGHGPDHRQGFGSVQDSNPSPGYSGWFAEPLRVRLTVNFSIVWLFRFIITGTLVLGWFDQSWSLRLTYWLPKSCVYAPMGRRGCTEVGSGQLHGTIF